MAVVYVPAQVQIPAHVQNHVLVESGTNWDFSRSARETPIVPLPAGAVVPSPAQAANALAIPFRPSAAVANSTSGQLRPGASTLSTAPVGSATVKPRPLSLAAATTLPMKPAVPVAPAVWTLKSGETISHGLEAWGQRAHWTVLWQLPRDWAVPATTQYTGSFEKVTGDVLRTLSSEGVLLKGEVYEGNHTLVVVATGEHE